MSCSEVRALHVDPAPSPDVTAPVATVPSVSLAKTGTLADNRVPMVARWSGSDPGIGVARYELVLSTDGGRWTPAGTTTSTTWTLRLRPGHAYRFGVRPVDLADNTGALKAGSTFRVTARQQSDVSVHWTGTWHRSTSVAWWGGSARASTAASSSSATTFAGRGIAFVAALGPGRGSARIIVDGHRVATVSLESATTVLRRIVWATTWPVGGTHSVRIEVVGTAGHPRVDVDGFVLVR